MVVENFAHYFFSWTLMGSRSNSDKLVLLYLRTTVTTTYKSVKSVLKFLSHITHGNNMKGLFMPFVSIAVYAPTRPKAIIA